MTYVWSASLAPATGAEAMFILKGLLVSASWTVISSSNGTVLSSGDIITSASVLANANAYFIVKQPAAATSSHGGWRREFGFQRGGTNLVWRVSYTVSSSHESGGTATTMATGGDRKWCFENGFQTGGTQTLFYNDNNYRFHICTETTPPFGFYAVSIQNGGGHPNCIVFDPLRSGSFHPNDRDPTVQWFQGDAAPSTGPFLFNTANGSNANSTATSSNVTARGWFGKQSVTESYAGLQVPLFGVWNAAGTLIQANAGVSVNHIDSTDNVYPIYYIKLGGEASTAGGASSFKGISSLFIGAWVSRSNGDTLSINSSKDYITFRHFLAVWDGSTPII